MKHWIWKLAVAAAILFLAGLLIILPKVNSYLKYHFGIEGLSGIAKLEMRRFPEADDVVFQGSDVQIAATLYKKSEERRPAIVFLHGSSTAGRKHAFSQLLCEELAVRDFHVLSMDMRGFGGSEDPQNIDTFDAWDSRTDIAKALDYLIRHASVDTGSLFIVGHSAGANQAIIAGIGDKKVRKIVAIGPSRRVQERVLQTGSAERQAFVARFSADRQIDRLLSWDVYKQIAVHSMMDTYMPYFEAGGHKPLLLIDGSLEDVKDRAFLASSYASMQPPKHYMTISGSNHYANTKALGSFIIYHEQVFSELVNGIAEWLIDESKL